MKEQKRIIISNENNQQDCHLVNYPDGAREDVLSGINMKMVDFMRSCNTEYDMLNAIDYFGKKFTYKYVFKQIEMYARAFLYYGIEAGDKIAVMLPNSPEIIYIKFALNTIGAVSVLIDPRVHPNTLLNYINDSKSKIKILISVLDKYKSTVEPVIDRLRVEEVYTVSPLQSISLDDINNMKSMSSRLKMTTGHFIYEYKKMLLRIRESVKHPNKFKDISMLLKDEAKYYGNINAPYIPMSTATTLFTSGTTGKMNGADICNEAYNSLYKNLQYGITTQTPGEKFCGIIPYFSSYGSGSGMFNCMCGRVEQYLYPTFNPRDFVKIIKRDKPNAVITVPNYCEELVDFGEKTGEQFESLQQIVIGGDKIDTSKVEKFRKFFDGRQVIIGYGETEFLGAIAVTLDNNARLDSSGVPFPSVKVKIVDPETMKEVPYFTTGEAYISNISMMLEYMDNCEETEKITAYDEDGNKYYGTGDQMYMTPDGQLCFVDRYKRLMKRPDGHQINPNPIEEALLKLDGVKHCCVVGLKYKNKMGVIPTAFVELEDDHPDLNKYLELFEEASIKNLTSPREKALAYVFIDKMPLSSWGKADVKKLSSLKLEEISEAIIVDNTFIESKKSKSYKKLSIK